MLSFSKIIIFLSFVCIYFSCVDARGARKESAVNDDLYDVLLGLIKNKGKLDTDTKDRTLLQRNALAQYYRYCKKYEISCSDSHIYLDGKMLLRKSEVKRCVEKVVQMSKGTSARYCARKIAVSSVGGSCTGVQKILDRKKKVLIHFYHVSLGTDIIFRRGCIGGPVV